MPKLSVLFVSLWVIHITSQLKGAAQFTASIFESLVSLRAYVAKWWIKVQRLAFHRNLFYLTFLVKSHAYYIICDIFWEGKIRHVNAIVIVVTPV